MLVVANRLLVADGREAEFVDLFERRTRRATEQPGCRRVELLEPVDADRYVIQAYWKSRGAFDRWRSSEAFRTAHADLPADLFAGPNQLELYELASEYVAAP